MFLLCSLQPNGRGCTDGLVGLRNLGNTVSILPVKMLHVMSDDLDDYMGSIFCKSNTCFCYHPTLSMGNWNSIVFNDPQRTQKFLCLFNLHKCILKTLHTKYQHPSNRMS